jgi:hypothetical protein
MAFYTIVRTPKETEMTISAQVQDSIKEATSCLRNALAFASRNEHPIVIQGLSEVLLKLDALETIDDFLGKLAEHKNG